jgi:hypothetical protein
MSIQNSSKGKKQRELESPLDVIEYILIESCMSGSHHPSLALKTILLLMKGCQEAMHPVPIVVLFDLMFDHSFDH